MNEIHIFHKKWTDKIIIHKDKNCITRINNNDIGKYKLNNNFLLIIWEKWGKEYYYLINNKYYQITDNYDFELDKFISNIFLIDDFSNSNIYLIDNILNKIYKKDNIDIFGDFINYENKIIINNLNIYYLFNNKYYNICYLEKLYNIGIFNINGQNKYYFFEKDSDSCYENYNFNTNYFYKKYNNKILIKNNQNNFSLLYSSDDNLNYKLYEKKNVNEFIINNSDYLDFESENSKNLIKFLEKISKNNLIIFINDENNENNENNLLNLIEYFTYFKFDCILVDTIDNIKNNILYDNYKIIYYNNIKDLTNIFNKKNLENNFKIMYTNENIKKYIDPSYNLIKINKLHIYNIISLTKINIIDIWYNLNKNKLEKYQYLLDFKNKDLSIKIPKIMHFIWIGKNKISNLYIKYIETWIKNHTDWIFCFWNDENIPILINQKYYEESNINAMKADILRYEILYIFGGVYVDCDFINCKNIDEIIKNYDGFSGYESTKYIAIGIMGFIKNDIILENIIKILPYNIELNNKNNLHVPELSGPIFFTKIWKLYNTSNHYIFPIDYFYSYTFNDKLNNKKIQLDKLTYAIHMWGHSWKNKNSNINSFLYNADIIKHELNINSNNEDCDFNKKFNSYYPIYYYLSNIIHSENINNKIKYDDISNTLKNIVYFEYQKNNKLNIVHIMGLFFTGGIEKYIYYIDKYGNHDKYTYYLLYISNDSYVYDIKNIKMYSFQWDHKILNKLLRIIDPIIVIDHYSIYLDNNENIYREINKNIILTFVHSAICYNKDISKLIIDKTINLYFEKNKDKSWENINENYYLTLGSELNNIEKSIKSSSEYFNIAIIGRIAEEKLPIIFFKKLCDLSNILIEKKVKIFIYGEKDLKFNYSYVKEFEKYIQLSCIEYCNFINPLNISDVYNNTDLVLIPSIYETGSFTCLEAYSYGIPVIGRNCYGLKYLIKNELTGYLCNNDEEILNILENIESKCNFDKNIILNESLKYNISDKIKDFENILDLVYNINNYNNHNNNDNSNNLNNNNNILGRINSSNNINIDNNNIFIDTIENKLNNKSIVIITSVLNCINKPLSYFNTRSIFTLEERYNQTIETINTINMYIPDIEIIFIECSDLRNFSNIENDIKDKVNYYFNFYDNVEIRECVNSEFKGLGEAKLLIEAINKIIIINNNYKNLFKISARYYINSDFNYDELDEKNNYFTYWDNSIESYCTIFYKLNYDYIYDFKNALINSIPNLYKNESIESCIYKNFKNNIKIVDKMNISGCLATEGYLFTI
jgi:mannosyltransferase OCH1-like enzyme